MQVLLAETLAGLARVEVMAVCWWVSG